MIMVMGTAKFAQVNIRYLNSLGTDTGCDLITALVSFEVLTIDTPTAQPWGEGVGWFCEFKPEFFLMSLSLFSVQYSITPCYNKNISWCNC